PSRDRVAHDRATRTRNPECASARSGASPPDSRWRVSLPDRPQRRTGSHCRGFHRHGGQLMNTPIRTLKDSAVIAERNLVKVKRVPVLLVYVLLSPIMFVLLFSFVFGGAIEPVDGSSYRE